jgi:hypothetical protein
MPIEVAFNGAFLSLTTAIVVALAVVEEIFIFGVVVDIVGKWSALSPPPLIGISPILR